MHLYGCLTLLAPDCAVCVCVLWYQIRVPVKNHIMCQTSVNLMPCCIKYTYRIQQKEQLGWRLEVTGNLGKGGWTKFEKGGGVVSNKGCLNKKGG